MYREITTKYDRANDVYHSSSKPVEHIAVRKDVMIVEDCQKGFATALGLLIAGKVGPKEPGKRAAIASELLFLMGSASAVDTSSFSCPIITL